MRKGFDGLCASSSATGSPGPALGTPVRLPQPDGAIGSRSSTGTATGCALWYKRLEKGAFRFPEAKDGRVEVTPAEMAAMLEGIDLSHARRLPRFRCPRRNPLETVANFACSSEDSSSHRRSASVLRV